MIKEQMAGFAGKLAQKTVLITGAGGGIGLEAARAFAAMGAAVLIAELDETKGRAAMQSLSQEFPGVSAEFYQIDLSEAGEIRALHAYVCQKYGFVDVLFHNAALIAIGNVEELSLETWDKSYRVNFKAPLLLTQLFLPHMKERNEGTIVFVSSSGAAPYMGAYEIFKTSQVELCSTLAAELEDTGIFTYTISPGLVKTQTAMQGIALVANRMGITTDAFYAMNDSHILGAEEAGCGFALSVLSAQRYHGQEIGSIQALLDAGLLGTPASARGASIGGEQSDGMLRMIAVYREQYAGWMERNLFERQWVLRDFKKTVGMSAEQFKREMERLEEALLSTNRPTDVEYRAHFEKLRTYFQRQYKLLQGFEKNPEKLKENSDILLSWIGTLEKILSAG